MERFTFSDSAKNQELASWLVTPSNYVFTRMRSRLFVCNFFLLSGLSAISLTSSSSCQIAHAYEVGNVVFDNGSPDFLNGHVSDTDQPLQQAGDFVLPDGYSTITAVRFFGSYASTFGAIAREPLSMDDFTVRFFNDENGRPAIDWLYEFRVGDISRTSIGIGPQLPRIERYVYETRLPSITLMSGTTYWLSIFNSTEFDSEFNWFWARSRVGGYWQNRPSDGEAWDHPRLSDNSIHYYESAFQLIGVPEPGSLALAICGVAGLAAQRVRFASTQIEMG